MFHLEKYESQWEGLSHISWKIKVMFQTTNQIPTVTTKVPSLSEAPCWSAARHFVPHGERLGRLRGFNGIL